MTMTVSVPAHLHSFVQGEVASGAFAHEEELVGKALELYRDMKVRHENLRADVQRSLDEVNSGEVDDLDIESTIARGIERLASQGCYRSTSGGRNSPVAGDSWRP